MPQIAIRKFINSTSALGTILGKKGNIGVDITKPTVVVFDGVTLGGIPLAQEAHVHADASGSEDGFMSAADYTYLYTHTHPNASETVAGFMSATDKTKLDGVSGGGGPSYPTSSTNLPSTIVLRDVSGNFAANDITAVSFIGPLTGNASSATNGVITTGAYADPSWITSLNASKLIGTIPAGVSFSGSVPWSSITGKPTNVSYFINDAGYINGTGNTSGTSGGVLSTGGRETSNPTPSTVILRSSTATAQVATPVASSDIANKAYVDANTGGYGYYPLAPALNPSNPFAAGGTIAPFSVTILSESATGYIKYILIDCFGIKSNNQMNNVFIGFTIDGRAETAYAINTFVTYFFTFNNNYSGDTSFFNTMLDLPYKNSVAIRIFTTSSISWPGTTQFSMGVLRYLRSA